MEYCGDFTPVDQSESVTVRNDGDFLVRRLVEVVKRRTVDRVTDMLKFWSIDTIMALDRVMKRAEKNDTLREVLAWIMSDIYCSAQETYFFIPQFEDRVLPRPTWRMMVNVYRLERFIELITDPVSSASELGYAFNAVVLLAAEVLLSFILRYLIVYVDRAGSKTYSSGSFDFRATYVSIVLFQGAYVWIKSRPAAGVAWKCCGKRKARETQAVQVGGEPDLQGIYVRPIRDKSGAISHYKYEPRFTPPREKTDEGTTLRFNRLSLGEYDTPGEAKIVRQIARFYYEKDEDRVQLEDGRQDFFIPPMSEEERALSGEEKRKWVTCKTKQVYADLLKEKQSKATKTGAYTSHGSDVGSDSFQSAGAVVTCSSPATTKSADELLFLSEVPSVASAHADELEFLSEVPSVAPAPLLPCDATFVGHGDSSEALSGCEDMIAELLYPELPNFSPQQSSLNFQMHYSEFAEILGDPRSPQVVGSVVTQGIEHILEPQSSPNLGWDLVGASGSSLFLEQSDGPVLQQLVQHQRKQLETSAVRIVGLEHQLSGSQIRNSELQREKELLQQENERLRTRLQQVAKSQVAAWSGIMIDI